MDQIAVFSDDRLAPRKRTLLYPLFDAEIERRKKEVQEWKGER